MRYAIYYTPPPDDPLTRAAERWLGRSAFTGETIAPMARAGLTVGEVAYHTAAARRYGFHATLKAPFRLAPGTDETELAAAFADFCAKRPAFEGPRLIVEQIEGFFALVPETGHADLGALAADVVAAFEPFRAPLSEEEILRRNPGALSPDEIKNLHMWGYPYVFETFRFHMTLTGRVDAHDAGRVRAAIEAHFDGIVPQQRHFGSLALFVEPDDRAPFVIRSFHCLSADTASAPARKTA